MLWKLQATVTSERSHQTLRGSEAAQEHNFLPSEDLHFLEAGLAKDHIRKLYYLEAQLPSCYSTTARSRCHDQPCRTLQASIKRGMMW
jgi:hypothetical protein